MVLLLSIGVAVGAAATMVIVPNVGSAVVAERRWWLSGCSSKGGSSSGRGRRR